MGKSANWGPEGIGQGGKIHLDVKAGISSRLRSSKAMQKPRSNGDKGNIIRSVQKRRSPEGKVKEIQAKRTLRLDPREEEGGKNRPRSIHAAIAECQKESCTWNTSRDEGK